MNFKHILFLSLLLTFVGCSTDNTPSGDNMVSFAQESYTLGILDNEEWFEIPISTSQPVGSKLNIGVEGLIAESSAIEDMHFVVESHTVTIPAGKNSAALRLKGIPEAIALNTPIGVKFRLLADNASTKNQISETSVTLQRCCPFDINNFTGYAVLTSTWSMQYMNSDSHLVRTHIDEEDANVVVIEDMFYDGYDIRIRLNSEDRLSPLAELCGDQVLGSTGEAFGTIYGNGKLMVTGLEEQNMVSYYSTCEGFLFLYTTMYVEEVGIVGAFANIIEWVSDDEAERIMREGF